MAILDRAAGRLKGIFDTIQTDRRQTEILWRDMSILVDPSRSTEEIEQRGRDRSLSTYDNTATLASSRLAALMFGNLTNPSLEWMMVQQSGGDETRDGFEWLQTATQFALKVFRSPKSGFNSAINEAFSDIATFGTASMFISGEDLIRFKALYLEELYFATNHFGEIDTVIRRKLWTADQAAEKFGINNLTDSVKKIFGSTKRYVDRREYLHFVMPRIDVEMDNELNIKIPNRFAFASIWIDNQEGKIVRAGGFRSYPYATGRWKVASGETYGTSPGIEVVDEIRLANSMKKTVIISASKAANLPLVVNDDSVIGSVRVLPGGITYISPGNDIKGLPVGDPNISDVQLERIQNSIGEAYFNDLDRLPDNDRMTATEVLQRRQDRLIALAPFVTRVQEELLGPIIERTLKLGIEMGDLEEPPPELSGGNVEIEYISPLAISQRSSRIQAFQIWVNAMLPLLQIDQSMVASIKTENVPAFLADGLNVPFELVRDAQEVAQKKGEMEQLAQLQQAAQLGGQLADTAKTAAEAGEVAGRIGVA